MLISKRFLFLLFAVLLTVRPAPCAEAPAADDDGIRNVLMIGNSYTGFNELNVMVEAIASSAGETLTVERAAKWNYTLRQHCEDPDTSAALHRRDWDLVVLQSYSVAPAVPELREQLFFPAVRELQQRIQARGARMMLFMTWGRRTGIKGDVLGHHVAFKDYDSMQDAVAEGYDAIGRELNVPVIPVGKAWEFARDRYPEIFLYQKDGSHPSVNGSYLAALTIFGMITGRCPHGPDLYKPPKMPADVAKKLQNAATYALVRRCALRRWRPRPEMDERDEQAAGLER